MDFERLGYESDGDIGVLTLRRPQVLNALDIPMALELEALSSELRERPRVRALVVTGAGRAFCAGGDLSSFQQPREHMQSHSLEITRHLHAAILNFSRLDLPTVAAVNGVAAGAGFALVCACDLAVAAQSAIFTAAYTLAGLSPDLGLTYFLPRIVGLSQAKSIILTNRRIPAAEAKELGLVAEVVPDGETLAAAKMLCASILKGSSAAIGVTKRLLSGSDTTGLEQQLRAESENLAALSASEDAYERCRRFIK
jgi:2-(1,2-epoxy-1,2-dihydrophenyl)acetyl-CoA isomerase